MRTVTLDASVILKWFFAADQEPQWQQARALAMEVAESRATLIQPPHWLAEVMAVVSHKSDGIAHAALDHLAMLDLPVLATLNVYRRATEIAVAARVHLFDSLYHAVALESSSTLITADRRYFAAARRFGNIALL